MWQESQLQTGLVLLGPYQGFMAGQAFKGRQALDATLQQLQTVQKAPKRAKIQED